MRLVQKVSQTSNKGNTKALCGLFFFVVLVFFPQIPAVPRACKRAQKPLHLTFLDNSGGNKKLGFFLLRV